MARIACIASVAILVVVAASAEPLIPTIMGHDISFDASNTGGILEYQTQGAAPDTLVFTRNESDHEATAYRPNWPDPPLETIWSENPGFPFAGGDVELGVQFTGQDAPLNGPDGILTVSLTGTGLNPEGVGDLMVYGTYITDLADPMNPDNQVTGLLWSLDLDTVSLYGRSGADSYILEGVGTLVGGYFVEEAGLVGAPGAMRGHIDFVGAPAAWMPMEYDPLSADPMVDSIRAAYSAETGWIPEPASLGLLLLGAPLLFRRR